MNRHFSQRRCVDGQQGHESMISIIRNDQHQWHQRHAKQAHNEILLHGCCNWFHQLRQPQSYKNCCQLFPVHTSVNKVCVTLSTDKHCKWALPGYLPFSQLQASFIPDCLQCRKMCRSEAVNPWNFYLEFCLCIFLRERFISLIRFSQKNVITPQKG